MAFAAVDTGGPQVSAGNPPVAFVYFLAFLCAISGFLLGYDTGIASAAMVFIRNYFNLDNAWHEYVVSITIISAAVFSLAAGYAADIIGRKWVVIISGVIFTPGALICAFAVNKEMLLIGRLILGIGIGMSSMIVPIYVAEVAPIQIRGRLVVTNLIAIFFGEASAGIIAAGMAEGIDEDVSWRWMLGIAAVPAIIQAFGFIFLPESPRYLVKKGREEEALKVLDRLRGGVGVDEEFVAIKVDCEETDKREAQQGTKFVIVKVLKDKNTRKALFVGCILWIVHEFSGVNTIMYYCGTIMRMTGVYKNSLVLWLASIPGIVSAFVSIASMFLIERLGRRKLLMLSLFGVIGGMVIAAIGFNVEETRSKKLIIGYDFPPDSTDPCLKHENCYECIENKCGLCFNVTDSNILGTCLPYDEKESTKSLIGHCTGGTNEDIDLFWSYDYCPEQHYQPTVLIGLCFYLLFFSLGLGPVSWAANAEFYPLWARSSCQAFAMMVNYAGNFIVSITFLTMCHNITRYGTFYFYAGIALLGAIYFYFQMPETKGLSLEDIDVLFLSEREKQEINNRRNEVRSQSIVTFRNSVISLSRKSATKL